MVILSTISKRLISLSSSSSTTKSCSNTTTIRFPITVTFSSFSTNNNNNSNNNNIPFRPRRRPPKQFLQSTSTPIKKISKKAKEPMKLSSNTSSSNLELQYGYNTATTIKHIKQTKLQKGDISSTTLLSNIDETMRLADYLSSATGSTEDLVGERRGLMMDDDMKDDEYGEDIKEFEKNLKLMMEEQSEFSFKDLPWKEDEEDNDNKNNKEDKMKSNSTGMSMEDGEDLNQKAFGPWSETIIKVDRVQKVQRGGTMVRYRALVVGGTLLYFILFFFHKTIL